MLYVEKTVLGDHLRSLEKGDLPGITLTEQKLDGKYTGQHSAFALLHLNNMDLSQRVQVQISPYPCYGGVIHV